MKRCRRLAPMFSNPSDTDASVDMTDTVSLIIPVHNGGDAFRRCLESIARAAPRPMEFIVVVDGLPDASADLARRHGAKVIELPETSGPARARNRGAETATGKWLWFVDADVEIPPDALLTIHRLFAEQPSIAAAFGSYDQAPGATNFLSQFKNLFHHYTHQQADSEASTFWAGCGIVRRSVFLEMNGFDESYTKPSIEDIEFGCRLKANGHRILLDKTLQVKHLKRWGVVSMLKADIGCRAVPWTRLILRRKKMPNDLNLKTMERISAALVWLMMLLVVASFFEPRFTVAAAAVLITLLVANHRLYLFFYRLRGWRFVPGVLFWHWAYYVYSSLTFAVVAVATRFQSPSKNTVES